MPKRIKEWLLTPLCQHRLGRASARGVLLTFDDGPHPRITPLVLERLARYDARAVFFVVGRRIAAAPELLRRIEAEGHIIGNHSYRHERGRQLGFWEYRRDLRLCQEEVRRQTGRPPVLFRPPFGERTPTTLLAAHSLGLRPMTWSLDVEDWRCRRPEEASAAAQRLVERVQPRDVVLLHDDHEGMLPLLDAVLPVLHGRGFDLASGIDGILTSPRCSGASAAAGPAGSSASCPSAP